MDYNVLIANSNTAFAGGDYKTAKPIYKLSIVNYILSIDIGG